MGGLVTRRAHRRGARINKSVYIASPHYGAPKAYFVLHPKIALVPGTIKSFILETAWNNLFRRAGDSNQIEAEVKRIARSFDSMYELMPDHYYYDAGGLSDEVVWYRGRSGRHNAWLPDANSTYFHHRAGFPSIYRTRINNALDFKRNTLGDRIPSAAEKTLVIYSNSLTTHNSIDFVRVGSRSETEDDKFENKEDFGPIMGDGTVPTHSARDFLGATNKQLVAGSHSAVPNDPTTIQHIASFLADPV